MSQNAHYLKQHMKPIARVQQYIYIYILYFAWEDQSECAV